MPPRLNIWGACRSLAHRSRPQPSSVQAPSVSIPAVARRQYAADPTPPPPNAAFPQAQTPTAPTFAQNFIPKVPGSFIVPAGDSKPLTEEELRAREAREEALRRLEMEAQGVKTFDEYTGLKFQEPPMPTAKLEHAQYHMRHRYEEGISQLTRLLMRDGKLSKAQGDMARVLTYLRTSPAPKINPSRPLLPGAPPPEHLPLNPNLYLMLAVDSVSPLVRIRGYQGLAGGGKALDVPTPLTRRARRRIAWQWLMDAVNKKPSMGSGKKQFAQKLGEEIVSIIEGRSGVWDRRNTLHKTATSVRANLNSPALMKRRRF